jgi:hypothetical protein
MHQLALAIHSCEAAYKKIPQAAGYFPGTGRLKPSGSWQVPEPADLSKSPPANFSTVHYFLLPYMEQTAKYMQFVGWTQDSQWDAKAAGAPVVLCPSDPSDDGGDGVIEVGASRLGVANYVANVQALGHCWKEQPTPTTKRRIPASFPDGTTQTMLFGERYAACPTPEGGRNAWLGTIAGVVYDPFMAINNATGQPQIQLPQDAPLLSECNPTRTQSGHPTIMNLAMADGSVRGINASLSLEPWRRLILPDDGPALETD